MEFQTNKHTGRKSSNGKYNYAAKLALKYTDRFFTSVRGLGEFHKDWKCVVSSYTLSQNFCFAREHV